MSLYEAFEVDPIAPCCFYTCCGVVAAVFIKLDRFG